ncbi:histidine kinase dimerization/phospho-acceptor domain-containing protein, partial [Planococcus sp. SIMBA_160]
PVPENHKVDQITTPDVELLQALTHEVRTPLTTIRMLTRLLLKRKDLGSDVLKRLRVIDQECSEQINRMELIFQATELEGKANTGVQLTPIP